MHCHALLILDLHYAVTLLCHTCLFCLFCNTSLLLCHTFVFLHRELSSTYYCFYVTYCITHSYLYIKHSHFCITHFYFLRIMSRTAHTFPCTTVAVRVTHSCYNSEHNNAYVTQSFSGKAKSSLICQMPSYYSDLITLCHSILHSFSQLQESQELIVKCQQQERKVSSWNRQTDTSSDDTPSDVPPAPLLLYRSSSMLVFQPAPFKHKSEEEVSYACKVLIEWFCSECSETNTKIKTRSSCPN